MELPVERDAVQIVGFLAESPGSSVREFNAPVPTGYTTRLRTHEFDVGRVLTGLRQLG